MLLIFFRRTFRRPLPPGTTAEEEAAAISSLAKVGGGNTKAPTGDESAIDSDSEDTDDDTIVFVFVVVFVGGIDEDIGAADNADTTDVDAEVDTGSDDDDVIRCMLFVDWWC